MTCTSQKVSESKKGQLNIILRIVAARGSNMVSRLHWNRGGRGRGLNAAAAEGLGPAYMSRRLNMSRRFRTGIICRPLPARRVRIDSSSCSSQLSQSPNSPILAQPQDLSKQRLSQTPRLSGSLDSRILRAYVRTRLSI